MEVEEGTMARLRRPDRERRDDVRIAYMTADEVNRHLAASMAEGCGVTLDALPVEDEPSGVHLDEVLDRYDAILLNLDDAMPPRRREILKGLLGSAEPRRIAVHGYDLDDEQVALLHGHGISAARGLDAGLLEDLRAVDPGRFSDPQDMNTWIMLG
jgi:hypothetical protein